MNTVKVAITIPEELVRQVDSLSKELGFSRSKFITLTLREQLEKEKKEKILKAYNEVFSDEAICEEQRETSRWLDGAGQSEGQEW